METLALKTENACSETYLRLGLGESGKGSTGKPRLLSYLSSLLEKSVQKNERFLETTQTKDVITVFHGSKAPSLGIELYIERIFKYSCCSPSCFIVAYIYVERFIKRTNAVVTSLNVHRLLITSVMVAAKYIDDAECPNFARLISLRLLLLAYLSLLFVSSDTFGKYCALLEMEGSGGVQIERSIQACGIKGSWPNNEDSTCATAAR
ncbi:cyclin-P3-1 isoform X2 [Coffea eugenioides]|uniref:cyclin-P3-1 isoform X2 n=1 Tax=Coffea eugenioides TaxID=49369 RepID=UPI000F6079DE|nr:cyclin-P3-1 isoform X2 [Coffea eugenioides]